MPPWDWSVSPTHREFEGRARWGATTHAGDDDTDDHGHCTLCAGTLGHRAYGVAKKVDIVAVKVTGSDGSGTLSEIAACVSYGVQEHLSLQVERKGEYKGSVANISLGTERSRSLDEAVANAVAQGLYFAVSAGNDDRDACLQSPAAAKGAVTAGASDVKDERVDFSNYGSCVDVFAPGVGVKSAWIGAVDATRTLSGTSLSSLRVAGLITCYLSLAPENSSAFFSGRIPPKEMKALLKETATRDVLTDVDSETPNLLVYNGGTTRGKGKQNSRNLCRATRMRRKGEIDRKQPMAEKNKANACMHARYALSRLSGQQLRCDNRALISALPLLPPYGNHNRHVETTAATSVFAKNSPYASSTSSKDAPLFCKRGWRDAPPVGVMAT
ncbi:peptidase S8/S53 domain-containing protein [Gamsiella multidivaricata]|uniref:peptidase S8/S53 domain-containing protein n=1 Tax=Gamsiella multidivaricata TaxID=101098 RepID=UPI002220FB09|nr:peptidase S8/S53 domain-containing protein [Gamsiella multidivaricata]KAI7820830.1 peptidase S8/S53 domain-containing protein [Gamsiella multidivaricata]